MAKTLIVRVLFVICAVFLLSSCTSTNNSIQSTTSGTISNLNWQSYSFSAPKNTSLFGIKCFTKMDCIAVGASNLSNNTYSTTATYKPIAFYSTTGGISWKQSTLHLNSSISTGILSAVDCYLTLCIVVGGSDPAGSGVPIVMVSSDNGKNFSNVNITSVTNGAYNSVFCLGNTDTNDGSQCLLGGQSGTSSSTSSLIDSFNLKSQVITAVSLPTLTNSFVSSITCTKDQKCIALGGYYNSSQNVASDIFESTDNGQTFSMEKISSLPSSLLFTACTQNQCYLAGAAQTKANALGTPIGYPALFEISKNSTSPPKTAITDKGGQGLMTGVFCFYSQNNKLPDCLATGGYGTSKSSKSVLATFTNNKWQTSLVNIPNISLYSITCDASAPYCLAVGNKAPTSTKSIPQVIKLTP